MSKITELINLVQSTDTTSDLLPVYEDVLVAYEKQTTSFSEICKHLIYMKSNMHDAFLMNLMMTYMPSIKGGIETDTSFDFLHRIDRDIRDADLAILNRALSFLSQYATDHHGTLDQYYIALLMYMSVLFSGVNGLMGLEFTLREISTTIGIISIPQLEQFDDDPEDEDPNFATLTCIRVFSCILVFFGDDILGRFLTKCTSMDENRVFDLRGLWVNHEEWLDRLGEMDYAKMFIELNQFFMEHHIIVEPQPLAMRIYTPSIPDGYSSEGLEDSEF